MQNPRNPDEIGMVGQSAMGCPTVSRLLRFLIIFSSFSYLQSRVVHNFVFIVHVSVKTRISCSSGNKNSCCFHNKER